MIKLHKNKPPKFLTEEKSLELVSQYKHGKKSVWNHRKIKDPLLESSFFKCAYCETKLNDPSIYMEVEHFQPKSIRPDLVVDWDNLLPSCKRCNGTKSDADINSSPIVNPYKNDPREEFYFDHFYIFGSTSMGENTETLLDLNEETLFLKRCKIAGVARKSIKDLYREFIDSSDITNIQRNRLKAVLLSAQRDRPYSASVATVIHTTNEYKLLKQGFKSCDKWTDELKSLHENSLDLVLPIK